MTPHPSHHEQGTKNTLGFHRRQWLLALVLVLILGSVGYIAWNPSQRRAEKRDEQRENDVHRILSALKDDYVANNNTYIPNVAAMPEGIVMMIVAGIGKTAGCNQRNDNCQMPVESDTACVDLSELVARNKLPEVPVSPSKKRTRWDSGVTSESIGTGYTLERRGESTLLVRACEAETLEGIEVVR